MLTYRAMFRFVEGGVHATVLDYPGAITCGATLEEARRLLRGALVDRVETDILHGQPLPLPDPMRTDPESDLEEPIHLILQAATHYAVVPQDDLS